MLRYRQGARRRGQILAKGNKCKFREQKIGRWVAIQAGGHGTRSDTKGGQCVEVLRADNGAIGYDTGMRHGDLAFTNILSLRGCCAQINHPFIAPPNCIAHTIAIRLHGYCAVYDPAPKKLARAISCDGQTATRSDTGKGQYVEVLGAEHGERCCDTGRGAR